MFHTYTLITIALIQLVQSQRYIIDNDNDLNRYIAFPIDICFQASAITAKFVKYQCLASGESVTKRIYSDKDCTTPTAIDSWVSTDTSPCGGPKFSCVGKDEYTYISYYTAGCLAELAQVPFMNGCFCDTQNTSYKASCYIDDSTGAQVIQGSLISYADTTTCVPSGDPNITVTTDIGSCYLATKDPFDIYAQVSSCISEAYSPTSSPTVPANDIIRARQISQLGKIYQYFLAGFVVVLGLITLLAWVDAWWLRTNDYFSLGAIGQMVFQTIDMMSDCFFVAEVSVQYKTTENVAFVYLLYLSMVFIILPNLVALFQLYFYAKSHWLDNDYVRAWLSKYSAFLLVMALMTGSSFSAVALLNSYLFQMELFDMGLTDKELKRFNTRRIWSVVVLENMPQLILQTVYFIVQGGSLFDYPITLSSMVFSVVSIIISLMSLTMERTINKTQRTVTVSMDVTGECVERASSKCRTMNYKLRKLLAPTLGVDWNVIEVVKPYYVSGGLALDIIVYVNRTAKNTDYGNLLNEANTKGKLPKIIQEAWNLSDYPKISGIRYKVAQSKQDRKNTERREKMGTASEFNNNNNNNASYAPAANTSISQRDKLPSPISNNQKPPPPKFNAKAKTARTKHDSIASQSALSQQINNNNNTEVQMQSEILIEMHEEGGGGDGEGDGGIKEGNDENDQLVENLVRMGYTNKANNKIAIQKANGDINDAIIILKEMKQTQAKKVQFVEVTKDKEDMPPPPKYNPQARKASKAMRKMSEASSVGRGDGGM